MSPSHAKSRPASRSSSPGKPAGKPTRAQKREEKQRRKAGKGPGFLSQIWESSVRLFVDRDRLKEAKAIADAVLAADPQTGSGGSSSGQA